MDVKAYISSGIIENYVLGLVSEEERAEVLRVQAEYPEVDAVIKSYQNDLESLAGLYAVAPPDGLKGRVMDAVKQQTAVSAPPALSAQRGITIGAWKRIAIAATILLLISAGINLLYLPKYQKYKEDYLSLLVQQRRTLAKNKAIETRLDQLTGQLDLLMNPAVKSIKMKGVNNHEGLAAMVFWNTGNRRTYLGRMNLPAPPAGKTYQLWAIVDGKPVDLGIYNPTQEMGPTPMKVIAQGKVQAFAITLEKAGGSPVPTMSQMYVMGTNANS